MGSARTQVHVLLPGQSPTGALPVGLWPDAVVHERVTLVEKKRTTAKTSNHRLPMLARCSGAQQHNRGPSDAWPCGSCCGRASAGHSRWDVLGERVGSSTIFFSRRWLISPILSLYTLARSLCSNLSPAQPSWGLVGPGREREMVSRFCPMHSN